MSSSDVTLFLQTHLFTLESRSLASEHTTTTMTKEQLLFMRVHPTLYTCTARTLVSLIRLRLSGISFNMSLVVLILQSYVLLVCS